VEPTVATPPALPQFDANVRQRLALTNPGGVVAINLNCSGTANAFNLVWASPPKSARRFAVNDFFYLGELPEVVAGKSDITALFRPSSASPPSVRRSSSAPSRIWHLATPETVVPRLGGTAPIGAPCL
jgi:hypothetical protein